MVAALCSVSSRYLQKEFRTSGVMCRFSMLYPFPSCILPAGYALFAQPENRERSEGLSLPQHFKSITRRDARGTGIKTDTPRHKGYTCWQARHAWTHLPFSRGLGPAKMLAGEPHQIRHRRRKLHIQRPLYAALRYVWGIRCGTKWYAPRQVDRGNNLHFTHKGGILFPLFGHLRYFLFYCCFAAQLLSLL